MHKVLPRIIQTGRPCNAAVSSSRAILDYGRWDMLMKIPDYIRVEVLWTDLPRVDSLKLYVILRYVGFILSLKITLSYFSCAIKELSVLFRGIYNNRETVKIKDFKGISSVANFIRILKNILRFFLPHFLHFINLSNTTTHLLFHN